MRNGGLQDAGLLTVSRQLCRGVPSAATIMQIRADPYDYAVAAEAAVRNMQVKSRCGVAV